MLKKAVLTGLVLVATAGMTLFGTSAHASDEVLSKNRTNVTVVAPITICGNAVAVVGKAKAKCDIGKKKAHPYR